MASGQMPTSDPQEVSGTVSRQLRDEEEESASDAGAQTGAHRPKPWSRRWM